MILTKKKQKKVFPITLPMANSYRGFLFFLGVQGGCSYEKVKYMESGRSFSGGILTYAINFGNPYSWVWLGRAALKCFSFFAVVFLIRFFSCLIYVTFTLLRALWMSVMAKFG